MVGYLSSSSEESVALKFALDGVKDDRVAVLFKIAFTGSNGLIKTEKFSAFPEEKEILIQDGLEYLVTSKKEIEEEIG